MATISELEKALTMLMSEENIPLYGVYDFVEEIRDIAHNYACNYLLQGENAIGVNTRVATQLTILRAIETTLQKAIDAELVAQSKKLTE